MLLCWLQSVQISRIDHHNPPVSLLCLYSSFLPSSLLHARAHAFNYNNRDYLPRGACALCFIRSFIFNASRPPTPPVRGLACLPPPPPMLQLLESSPTPLPRLDISSPRSHFPVQTLCTLHLSAHHHALPCSRTSFSSSYVWGLNVCGAMRGDNDYREETGRQACLKRLPFYSASNPRAASIRCIFAQIARCRPPVMCEWNE